MTGVRRAVTAVSVVAAVTVGVVVLREATEYRGGSGEAGASTTVTFRVETRDLDHETVVAARALWQTCVISIGWTSAGQAEHVSADVYRAEVTPSLASDTKRRLRGCLNEATLSRVQGHVISTVDRPARG